MSHSFSDVIKPTKNLNLRTQPTCLRSRLYRLVEPLTIKPIRMTQLPVILKNAPPTSSQVPNLFFPKLPMHQDSVSDGDVVCVLCVPVLPASCSSARRRSQWEPHRAKGGCVMPLWRKRTHTHTHTHTKCNNTFLSRN